MRIKTTTANTLRTGAKSHRVPTYIKKNRSVSNVLNKLQNPMG